MTAAPLAAAPLADAPAPSRRASTEAPDAELLGRLAAGDLTSLGVLYDRYANDVRRFAARASSLRGDEDDVTHEVFLTLMKVAGAYDGRMKAKPFLLGIAATVLLRRRRALGRLGEVLTELARSITRAAPRTPEEAMIAGEEMAVFKRALRRLSHDKRLVFLMIEGEGLAGEEVAQALGIPVATVRTRLHHARREIRAAMGRGSER